MKPRVLMIAFACNPAGSGEHWLGWGWAAQAATFCDVTLVTWDRYAAEVQAAGAKAGIRAVCLGVPGWINRIGKIGTPGRWLRLSVWHQRAAKAAAALHRQQPFAIVHQTTFHSFRTPFRAASMGIPAVWGPIAGGETCPPGFGPWLGSLRWPEAARARFNGLALAHPGVRRSLRDAHVIFVSNHTTLRFLPADFQPKCLVVPPNALRDDPPAPPARSRDAAAPLRLLFVGNCVATRSLPLVFEALRRAADLPARLTVVGGGAALQPWKDWVARADLGTRIEFTGPVPREKLAGFYAAADAFVFPALRDSGGSGLLEAMSFGLPVVCCDWAGPAEMVDESCGIKVPVSSPEAAIQGFIAAFSKLHRQPGWRQGLGTAAYQRVRAEFTWDKKRRTLESVYADCLAEKGSRSPG